MTDIGLNVSFDELCDLIYIERDCMVDIIEYGIAKPVSGSGKNDWYFEISSIIWLKKAVRIYDELEVDWVAVAMIIDLLKQKQILQSENQLLKKRISRFNSPDY